MAAVLPPGLFLTGRDCARLYGPLVRALHETRMRDGAVPPQLLHLVADVRTCAEEYRASVLVKGRADLDQADVDLEAASSGFVHLKEQRLSTGSGVGCRSVGS